MYDFKKSSAFTLIELLIVILIVAIFSAIAIPSYQSYARRALATQAQQEIQRLAVLLDKHKARNFTYKGFDIASETLPVNALDEKVKYIISVRDGDQPELAIDGDNISGRNWAIQAQSTDPKNYTFLLTSQGVRCKNKVAASVDFVSCGESGQEEW